MVRRQHALATPPAEAERVLSGDEVHLYVISPGTITDPIQISGFESILSESEKARMRRFHSPGKRHQYLVSRALLRTRLSHYHHLEPAAWQFEKNGYGKPEISFPDAGRHIRFNLSHADGVSVCAFANGREIGVDVEDSHRTTRAGLRELGKYFSLPEAAVLRAVPAERLADRFFDYWTLKEAYIKARGAGFAIALDTFGFTFEGDRFAGFSAPSDSAEEAVRWQFRRLRLAGRYRLALAIERAEPMEPDVQIRVFRSAPWCDESTLPLQIL